jgi:N-methylhydantoinase A/oxoprolinase/acetone carboxylase beta subunit
VKTVHLIGCGVLAADLNRIAADLQLQLKTTFLPAGLHDRPKELQTRLQAAIDSAGEDSDCCRIIVGYGICGRGTVGILATSVPLVFPRVHDCVALFLGSDKAYKNQFAQYPGTFYLTAGWQLAKNPIGKGKDRDKKIWVGSEAMGSDALKRQYGERGAEKIIDFFSSWQKNYQRAAFIDTGLDRRGKYARQARKMAEEHGWRYEKIAGDDTLLRRLLTQDSSSADILVVPPGYCTLHSALIDGLDCAPLADAGTFPSPGPQPPAAQVAKAFQEDTTTPPTIHYGLGVDAGGTYTDAVIYDFHDQRILCKSKRLTTKWDFSQGIDQTLAGLDQDLLTQVAMVSVSTTLATNAIVEGHGQKTGLLLMHTSPACADLIGHLPKRLIEGYINIDGQEIRPIDEEEVRRTVREMVDRDGVRAFAVSGFAGAVNPIHELQVKEIIEQETGMVACCGHELSDLLDFTVRAQTAVLNARIIPMVIRFLADIEQILENRGITAPIMVVKGDGTLISAGMARERPVETILSGPAASVAGARLLTGLDEALVVDMGGTTSDIAEISDDAVAVCQRGARVGEFFTHVKALDMQTVGLGGDSLIRWQRSGFAIGPNRVAPLVYAGSLDPAGTMQVMATLDHETLHLQEQLICLLSPGADWAFRPTAAERQIVELLRSRPHTPEELAAALDLVSARFLPLERLTENGLVQRAGLTPTDLLHILGSYRRWEPAPAEKMLEVMAAAAGKTAKELLAELLGRIEKALALELVRHLVFRDAREPGQQHRKQAAAKEAAISPVFQHLIDCLLEPTASSRYTIAARLHIPVIGVGAPIGFFLPGAGRILDAQIIVPPDGDVANAVGAITSRIAIHQKLVIRPGDMGDFVVTGVTGTRSFAALAVAQEWAIEYLQDSVRSQGMKAGTSNREVRIGIDDRVVTTAQGVPLFLERVITADLIGTPDLN